jgi:hypothetical protein
VSFVPPDPWSYFAAEGDDEAAALERLRESYLGSGYDEAAYADELLTLALTRAVREVERYTSRVFARVDGTLDVDGTGVERLWLPLPIVSEDQGGDGVSAVTIGVLEPSDVDADAYHVREGLGPPGDDPRDNPWIELLTETTFAGGLRSAVWPRGSRNVHVTASWGYVEADGTTPEAVRYVVARLLPRYLPMAGDAAAAAASAAAGIVQESTEGRSYVLATHAVSAGLTGDRALDIALNALRRPVQARISRVRPTRATTRRRW